MDPVGAVKGPCQASFVPVSQLLCTFAKMTSSCNLVPKIARGSLELLVHMHRELLLTFPGPGLS